MSSRATKARLSAPAASRSADAAQQRQQQALREQLADNTAARCPQTQSHRDLPLPGSRPGQEQIGQVRAGDQQDEAGKGEQQPQRATRRLREARRRPTPPGYAASVNARYFGTLTAG